MCLVLKCSLYALPHKLKLNVILCLFRNLHIMPFWILFESVMTVLRMRAALTGLMELSGFNKWTVTKKIGSSVEDTQVPLLPKTRKRLRDRYDLYSRLSISWFKLDCCMNYNLYWYCLLLAELIFPRLDFRCFSSSVRHITLSSMGKLATILICISKD